MCTSVHSTDLKMASSQQLLYTSKTDQNKIISTAFNEDHQHQLLSKYIIFRRSNLQMDQQIFSHVLIRSTSWKQMTKNYTIIQSTNIVPYAPKLSQSVISWPTTHVSANSRTKYLISCWLLINVNLSTTNAINAIPVIVNKLWRYSCCGCQDDPKRISPYPISASQHGSKGTPRQRVYLM
jgi:hypothetical protein